jgi:hypothetical protein
VFDSQREHRQKSFVQPSSSSFSALLVYGSFAGRILILTSSFLLLSAQSGFSLSSHPSPRFRLGRRSICFSRYQRSLSFLLRRSSMQDSFALSLSVGIATVSARPDFTCHSLRSFCSVSSHVQVLLKASDRAPVMIS